MIYTHIPKIGGLFQFVPPEIASAWAAFRPQLTYPWCYAAHRRTPERAALERTVWEVARRTGCFAVDGYLVGWSGPRQDRTFTCTPNWRPIDGSIRP